MLIARVCPVMYIYIKHGGHWGYRGHILNMPQDVQSFIDRLSRHAPSNDTSAHKFLKHQQCTARGISAPCVHPIVGIIKL